SGIRELCEKAGIEPSRVETVFHGTTVATNALLEHRGARVGMVTTAGFRDVVHIGRHQRPQHYSIRQEIPWQNQPFARRADRKVVTERLGAGGGEVITPLAEDEVRTAARELREQGVEAVAVCFLFSYLNPDHELRAAEILREELPGAFVTTSAEVAPQFREFERFMTAAINAFVGPGTGDYLLALARALESMGIGGELRIMMSNGGLSSASTAGERPVTLLMSGPTAGVLGGAWAAELADRSSLITFDMGGTSTDIGIVCEGQVTEASARDTWLAGYPVMVPMVDLHTIGHGGGSIAHVDDGGGFRVGPRSAGADPGPAAYGLGGTEATITDANLVLGRLVPDRFLGGTMGLDAAASEAVVGELAAEVGLSLHDTAEGIIRLANEGMAQAIRSRTVQKGIDPRTFTLVAFGGAGPLHAVEVAAALEIAEVLIPPFPGITCAVGLLASDLKYDRMRTVLQSGAGIDAASINRELAATAEELREALRGDGIDADAIEVRASLDCRYLGQGYELRLPLAEARFSSADLDGFHQLHAREYGYSRNDPIEIVNLRITALGARPALQPATGALRPEATAASGSGDGWFRDGGALVCQRTAYVDRAVLSPREEVEGPAVICQPDSTVVVPPGWCGTAHESGSLILRSEA
ncbi:MAG TPA: hydantoinase/oxoprolinase family protein, partial [Solirubrobacterales bacterium]|nr:hydantoinase/oxoprolinase family protein [Solirubrobacterales bacterium]